ncbi:MAG: hypothetical protein Ta2F_14580 [Termitinemataceae bacterium]|nr:MAG: hypothetical protein Ta2F_14580 [Termitinemataceae bacterium]
MTKQEIVQAAFRVWGARNYRKTSLQDLALELGVTKPALYKHFKNKEALCDTMFLNFFDRFAACAEPYYKEAISADKTSKERIFLMNQAFVEFYIRNRDDFIFSISEVYGNEKYKGNLVEQMRLRCIDLHHVLLDENECEFQDIEKSTHSLLHLITTATVCMLAYFHGNIMREKRNPSEDEINKFSNTIAEYINYGLKLNRNIIDGMDWKSMEKKNEDFSVETHFGEDQNIMKAVANVVAIEGPWNASMQMIAEKLGLSKSSLYSHFKNKLDMMRRLFFVAADDIVKRAHKATTFSSVPEEQLYFAIMSIVSYLKSNPEILIVLDRIRMRSSEFYDGDGCTDHCSQEIFDLKKIHLIFSNIKNDKNESLVNELQTDYILFLIINILIQHPNGVDFGGIQNKSFRILYKFIALGIEIN